jgi:YVTN family beta-propeller protein
MRLACYRHGVLVCICLLWLAACGAQHQPTTPSLPVLATINQLRAYHIYVTDLGTGNLAELGQATVNGGKSLHGIAFSPDGKRIYVGDIAESRVVAFDVTSAWPRQVLSVTVGLSPVHFAFAQAGRYVYVTNFGSASISVIDTTLGKVIATIQTPQGPHGLVASPDGTRLYVACLNGQALAVIDTTTNTLDQTIPLPDNTHPYSVVSDTSGRYLYITDNFIGRVLVVDTTRLQHPSQAVVGGGKAGQQPVLLAISPDGKRLYVTNSGGNLSILDISTDPIHPALVAAVAVGRSPHGVAVSPDGRYIIVANILSGNLSVVDAASTQVIATIPAEKYPNDVAIAAASS